MPVVPRKIRGKLRLVEAATGKIAKNNAGTPLDGGGGGKVAAQARAVNASLRKKGKI